MWMTRVCYMLSHNCTIGSYRPYGSELDSTHCKSDGAPLAEDLQIGKLSACCGSCKNSLQARPRFVAGVFADLAEANGAAERLRCDVGRDVHVVSSSSPALTHGLAANPTQSIMACSRLYQQITQHLDSGATIVVFDAQSPEQQLGASRILLQAKCEMLLTHDGRQHVD